MVKQKPKQKQQAAPPAIRAITGAVREPAQPPKAVEGDGWELVTHFGTPVFEGEEHLTFRGDPLTITGGRPPHKAGSTGRVHTNGGEFFPSVMNMEWRKKVTP
jgi:hypothetical protein